MLGKRIDSLLLLLVAGSLQGGCFLSRGVSEDIVPVNLEAHDLTPVPRDVEISMAAALLTVESGADWIRHSITGAGPEVEAMKKGMRDGLVRANPGFRPTDQTTVAIPTICSLDVGAAGATSLIDARSCILPSQLPPLTSDDPSTASGRHLLLLLRGKTERIKGDVDLQLGVAPGYGGVPHSLREEQRITTYSAWWQGFTIRRQEGCSLKAAPPLVASINTSFCTSFQ